jgi:glyoxylase-like metal-dependent hydrolase (beta-lactamase superfamily II)
MTTKDTVKDMVIPISLGAVNAFLLKGERSVLVDTGYPRNAAKILNGLSVNGVNPEDVSLIIITHSHHDHSGSVLELRERTGAKVAVHRFDAEALRLGVDTDLRPYGMKGRFARMFSLKKSKAEGVESDIIIEDEMNLEEFGIKGKVISTPGHTSGSISIILDSGEAIVSDLIMGRFIIRGSPAYPFYASDISEIRKSIRKIIALGPNKVYASHGGPFYPEDILRSFRDDLR